MVVTAASLNFQKPNKPPTVSSQLNALYTTMEPIVLSRTDFDDGSFIETLEPADGGEMYYRTCYQGMCRYSSDLWQAQVYQHQMTSP